MYEIDIIQITYRKMLVKTNEAKKNPKTNDVLQFQLIKNSNLLLKTCVIIHEISQKYSNAFSNFDDNYIKHSQTFPSRYVYMFLIP